MSIPDENLMTISATQLKEHPPEFGYLRSEMTRHVKQIEAGIREAVRSKLDHVIYEVPTNFAVRHMSNKRAQLYVYSAIIDQLKMNGFQPSLHLDVGSAYFTVRWKAAVDRDELGRQMRLVRGARCNVEPVDEVKSDKSAKVRKSDKVESLF